MPPQTWYDDLEENQAVRDAADRLATAEHERNVEYLRLVGLGENPYVAQKKADILCGRDVMLKRAEYEIKLARLRR